MARQRRIQWMDKNIISKGLSPFRVVDGYVLLRYFTVFLMLLAEISEKGGGNFWRGTEKSVDCWSRLVPTKGLEADKPGLIPPAAMTAAPGGTTAKEDRRDTAAARTVAPRRSPPERYTVQLRSGDRNHRAPNRAPSGHREVRISRNMSSNLDQRPAHPGRQD